MDGYLLIKAIGFILLAVFGIPGNVYIVLKFVLIRIIEKRLLANNIILTVLALVNLLVVLSRVIPQSMQVMGVENLLDDTRCKFVIFTYRMSRAMSICITSLLSCHQCILIAPTTKFWMYLKQKVTKNVSFIILLILLINIVVHPASILYSYSKKNSTSSPYTLHLVYCDTDFITYVSYIVNGSFYACRDFIFVGMMALASIYIVYMLLQHAKSAAFIKISVSSQRKSAEQKASKAVILLVVCYVLLFGLDNSMWIYTIVLSCSYATLSPIVIIATNPRLHMANVYFPKIYGFLGVSV
uniref:Vomeronasal type-1 receptor n=1 Tax=Xenopus tropicalis TaxID=8364 RepID=A0A6I8R865_XENTR